MTYAASATRILDRDRFLANGRPCVPWPRTARGGADLPRRQGLAPGLLPARYPVQAFFRWTPGFRL